jgi:hypothetical protein
VAEADASTRLVKYARATTERTGDVGPAENDTGDELEDATEAESAALAAADTTEIRRYAWRKPLPYWGLMMLTKGTGRRYIARTLTCDSFGTCGPAQG